MTATPKMGLDMMSSGTSQKHLLYNLSMKKLDTLAQCVVKSMSLTAPPGSPVNGDAYIPAATATGLWAGLERQIVVWIDQWLAFPPVNGYRIFNLVDRQVYTYNTTGTVWETNVSALDVLDSGFQIKDNSDPTKIVKFQASGLTTGTTRTLSVPDISATLAHTGADSQSFTGRVSFKYGVQPPVGPMKRLLGANGLRIGPANCTSTSDGLTVANRLFMVPVVIPWDMTAVALSIRITTLGGSNCRLGIYNDDGGPTTRVLDAGVVSTGSTGLKELTISQFLPAGVYWLAAVFDGAPACNLISGRTGFCGQNSASSSSSVNYGYYRSFTYATLPTDESATTYTEASAISSGVPCILIG